MIMENKDKQNKTKEKTVCNYCLEWVDELSDKFGCKECIQKYNKKITNKM